MFQYETSRVLGTCRIFSKDNEKLANILNTRMKNKEGGQNQMLAIMLGMLSNNKDNPIQANLPVEYKSQYSQERYKFFLEAPFDISNRCCNIMKKDPAHNYSKTHNRYGITAQMAEESRLRMQKWRQNGCNGFDMKMPVSNPMSFWTENDVLEYIVKTGIPICSVYGNIVEDYGEQLEGQISLADYGLCEKKCKYKCTGCKRTGCVLCGYGAHLESKEESRFRKLKISHPKFYGLLDLIKNNGVTFREAIEWTNEHLGKNKIWL